MTPPRLLYKRQWRKAIRMRIIGGILKILSPRLASGDSFGKFRNLLLRPNACSNCMHVKTLENCFTVRNHRPRTSTGSCLKTCVQNPTFLLFVTQSKLVTLYLKTLGLRVFVKHLFWFMSIIELDFWVKQTTFFT
jgi:hypothetical protein